MHFSSVLSDLLDTEAALEELLTQVTETFYEADGGTTGDPDLIVAFFSSHHRHNALYIGERIRETFPHAQVLGSSAGGVVAAHKELEGEPALALTAARMPGVALQTFHLEPEDLPLPDDAAGWRQAIAGNALVADPAAVLLLPDPFTLDIEKVLGGIQAAFPTVPIVGGVASGARLPGQTRLLAGEHGQDRGLVGLTLSGNVVVDTVVAQGCRPIGVPMFVTRAEANLIHELDGRPAAEVIQELYGTLSETDQKLARQGLFVGLVMSEQQQSYGRGDFLVRNVLGFASEHENALAVAAMVRSNTVVQFQLRDAQASAEDLIAHLRAYAEEHEEPPAGGLMFSCLGRGQGLYGRPDHDSSIFAASVGDVPLGGFFCNGEIGPVGGQVFLHAYTSAFALFRPAASVS